MRIVLDTNILLTSFSSRSINHWIWLALVEKKYILCITYDILLEYEEVITRHASPELASAVTDALLDIPNVELITRYFAWNMITSDPDDNKFVDCDTNFSASDIKRCLKFYAGAMRGHLFVQGTFQKTNR